METTGTKDMATKAMAMVDMATTATMTTLLVTMDMVLDMIIVSTDMHTSYVECLCR